MQSTRRAVPANGSWHRFPGQAVARAAYVSGDIRTDERAAASDVGEAAETPAAGHTLRDVRVFLDSRRQVWTFYDAAVATVSATLGFRLTPFFLQLDFSKHSFLEALVPVYGLVFVMASFVAGTYDRRTFQSMSRAVTRAFIAAGGAWVAVIVFHYLVTYQFVGRWIVAIATLTATLASALPRVLLSLLLGRSQHGVLVVGGEQAAAVVGREIERNPRLGMKFAGSYPACLSRSAGPSRGAGRDLVEVCHRLGVDTLVVAEDSAGELVREAVDCRRRGVHVTALVSFVEDTFKKVPVGSIGPSWLISADMNQTRPLGALAKRAVDIVLAAAGLALTLPFWPLVALLTKLSSRGPVFYSQERVGVSGRAFRLHKFRTMRVGAEAEGNAVWAAEKDPRATFVGKILRKTRIDEIPQFWDVLKGDMAFVGPRPERPEFVERLAEKIPHYQVRHLVRPGITGWAQVSYPYGASVEDAAEKLRYDLYYVKHGSLAFDMMIVLRTVGTVFRGSR